MEQCTCRNAGTEKFFHCQKRKYVPADENEEEQTRSKKTRYERKFLFPKTLKSKQLQKDKSLSIIDIPEINLPTDKLCTTNDNIYKKSTRKILKSDLKKNKGFRRNSCDRSLLSEYIRYKRAGDDLDAPKSKILKLEQNKSNKPYVKKHKLCKKPNIEDNKSIENKKLQNINHLRLKGNAALRNKDYELAIELYTRGFSIEPKFEKYNSLLYFNAGYAYMLIDNHPEAIEHFEKAISLDKNNLKAKRHKILCLIKTEEFDEAEKEVKELLVTHNFRENKNLMEKIMKEKAEFYKKEGDKNNCEIAYMKALKSLTNLIDSNETNEVLLKRAEVYMQLNLLSEALIDVEKVIKNNAKNIAANKMKIELLTMNNAPTEELIEHLIKMENIESSEETIQQLKNIYIKKGLHHIEKNEFQEAMDSYNNAIKYMPHDMSLYEMRAKLAEQLNDCFTIISDTSKAIEMGSTDITNWVMRSKCLLKNGLYKEAYEDASFAYNRTLCPKIANLVDETKEGILRNSQETYYDILGVKLSTNNKDIRKKYLKLSMLYHPDKWSKVNEYFRNAFQERFKKVLESYTTLTNPVLKGMYDISIRRPSKCF